MAGSGTETPILARVQAHPVFPVRRAALGSDHLQFVEQPFLGRMDAEIPRRYVGNDELNGHAHLVIERSGDRRAGGPVLPYGRPLVSIQRRLDREAAPELVVVV